MTGLHHPLVQDYLTRLDRATASLPPPQRVELLTDLTTHLQAALTPESTDADVRNLLQSMGSPEEVAYAAYADLAPAESRPPLPTSQPGPVGPSSPWGPVEVIAVVGLTAGTFVAPVVGPLVGLVLAWVSERWTRREKVVATVLTLLPTVVLLLGFVGLFALSTVTTSGGTP